MQVVVGDQLGVADKQEFSRTGEVFQCSHRAHHLSHLAGATVVGPVQDRHPAIPGHRQPGLDLLEVRAPVFGMTESWGRIAGIGVFVSAVQRDRGHVPMASGHVEPEPGDRLRPNGSDDAIQLRRDRVQSTADPVVVECGGIDTQHFLNRPRSRPVRDTQQRCR